MAITFPRSFPASMRVVGMTFMPQPHMELTPTRGGLEYAAELGDTRWKASFQTPPLTEDQVDDISAWYLTLLSYEPFWGYDLRREYPKAYPNGWGSMVAGSPAVPFTGYASLVAVTEGGKMVELTTLPAGFILSVGDYLAFDFGAVDASGQRKRALHRIVVGATGANPTVEVRPPVSYSGVNTTMVSNPSFVTPEPPDIWTKGTGWTIPAGGNAVGTNVVPGVSISQSIGLQEGQAYRVVWSIGTITSGALQLSVGGAVGIERSTAGTFTEIITAGNDPRIFVVARTANFNGTVGAVNVYPAVSLYKPAAKMIIVPDTYEEPIDLLKMGQISFDAIQVL